MTIYIYYLCIGEPSVEMLCGNRPCHDDTIKRRDIFSPTAKLVVTCSVSTPLATVYWYRNGEDITAHSSGGVLMYETGGDDGILGVYQCFAVTQAGVDYDTLRVLKPGDVQSNTRDKKCLHQVHVLFRFF